MSSENEKIKICRHCHTIYKSLTQKFCGNGCQLKEPYYIDGHTNHNIISREIKLEKTKPLSIRWVCNRCMKEYKEEELKTLHFICECGSENDFYPFTTKHCEKSDCTHENKFHNLQLEAKACDLCGQSNFLYNHSMLKRDLKPSVIYSEQCWEGPEEFIFSKPTIEKAVDKSLPYCSITILNNNLQYIVFGENRDISVHNLIKDAQGFLPDIIYENLLAKFSLDDPIFSIKYNSENEEFSFLSELRGNYSVLDDRFFPKTTNDFNPKEEISLQANILTQIKLEFFKIHIWIY
ncbi:MAG: hypothetical protein ACTSYI_12380 [Promethearchaeota archaeon]